MLLELLSGRLPQYDAAAHQLQSVGEPAWMSTCGSAEEGALAHGLWQLGLALTSAQPARRPSMAHALLCAVFERDVPGTHSAAGASSSKSLGARFEAVRALLQQVCAGGV